MNGFVDERLRALVRIPMAESLRGERQEITAWIDTAFNGGFVLPRPVIDQLNLTLESSAEAVLADGRTVELETYSCFFDWFGESYETQIVANDGDFPLLGTMLLAGHRLEVDYLAGTLSLE